MYHNTQFTINFSSNSIQCSSRFKAIPDITVHVEIKKHFSCFSRNFEGFCSKIKRHVSFVITLLHDSKDIIIITHVQKAKIHWNKLIIVEKNTFSYLACILLCCKGCDVP